jgi:hypothetical protein
MTDKSAVNIFAPFVSFANAMRGASSIALLIYRLGLPSSLSLAQTSQLDSPTWPFRMLTNFNINKHILRLEFKIEV